MFNVIDTRFADILLPYMILLTTFGAVYRIGLEVMRRDQRKHYRRMLILYQASATSERTSWFWHVTMAPVFRLVIGARQKHATFLDSCARWAGRHVLGKGTAVRRQDLTRILAFSLFGTATTALIANGDPKFTAGGLLLGLCIPIFLSRRQNHRRNVAFLQQLPEILTVMISSLRAGQSLAQAIDVVAGEVNEPARTEFALVAHKRRLGVDMADALSQLAQRVDCTELHLFVRATIVQRETGGNLVPMLETIYTTVRERVAFQGEVRTMTAQQRMGALVVTILPVGLFGVLALINPVGLSFFWTAWPIGPALLGTAIFLVICGHLIISRLLVIG